jgi:transposase
MFPMKKPKRLDFTEEEVDALLTRIESGQPQIEDFPLLADILRAMIWLEHELKEKRLSIKRLKAIFGIKTEKLSKLSKELLGKDLTENNSASDEDKEKKEKVGHGHRGPKDYQAAKVIKVAHESLKKRSICPDCGKGKLFNLSPGSVIRIIGGPWLNVEIYKPERLRCPICQKIFTATLPEELYKESRVDKSAKAIVSILKYRGGVPFYRQEQIQTILGNPISDTEIWKMTDDVADCCFPIVTHLCQLAADAEILHNDDTTARILDLRKENEKKNPERKGIFTTAILGKIEEKQIALFITGRQHAGENLNDLLDEREEPSVPIQSCDALSRNIPKDHKTQIGYCNAHARRKFYEIAPYWPQECLKIVASYNLIFLNDKNTKSMQPEQRLNWHQQKSAPVMEKMKTYCHSLLEERKVEPNSSLGKAINYVIKHWKGLTLFLEVPGVPISNNDDERLLKRAVLNRKNAYFFKTENGAKIADTLLSVIETCALNQVNPYNYLIALQQYVEKVVKEPHLWLPWNYTAMVPP